MSCKTTLEKIGRKAYEALEPYDQFKTNAASGIVAILGNPDILAADAVGLIMSKYNGPAILAPELNSALIKLASEVVGYMATTLKEACEVIAGFLKSKNGSLWAKWAHDIAGFLALFLGVDENPAGIGAILEYVYTIIVKPLFS